MPVIVENLSYVYSPKTPYERAALKNVSLKIEDGEFFGIIGHTGSGKSTLIQHLNALIKLKKASGSGGSKITVDEFKLHEKPNLKKLRMHIGMVFQYPEYQLFDETVEKDVMFGPKNMGVPIEECRARAKEAIELCGLNYLEIKDASPFEISGGQKRRACIAGVVAMRPKILVLDEPTAGLDPKGRREIMDLILKIKAATAHTVIMITHSMEDAARYCDRIAVLSGGGVECVAAPGELFKNRDRLLELGLDIPQAAEAAYLLNKGGFSLPHVYTEEGLVSAVTEFIKGREARK